jgi:hypothetical protein
MQFTKGFSLRTIPNNESIDQLSDQSINQSNNQTEDINELYNASSLSSGNIMS